jgi:serpin B
MAKRIRLEPLRARIGAGVPLLLAGLVAACGSGTVATTATPPGGSGTHQPTDPTSSAPPAVAKAFAAAAAVDPALVAADNGFGLSLLNTLLPANSGNVAIAPISVAMALQIVYNGAAGTTQQAMAQTLELGSSSTATLNADNAALEASLLDPDPKVTITLANSLWLNPNLTVSPSFTAADETYYGATVGSLAGAPDNVNAWVDAETQGLITQILPAEPPGYYQEAVYAVIANVIYFKGQWSSAFDPNQTVPAPFTRSDGSQVTSEMMTQTGILGYYEGSNFQALRLPYGQGVLSMLIVLPKAGVALDGFVAGITPEAIDSWVGALTTENGTVGLPRFSATFGTSLPPALTSLGMGSAFCASHDADFSGIAPLACISDVEHKTVVEVDESGTVAAGATTVTVGTADVPASQFSITMDHPFFYAIRDDRTGELLFVGVLLDPTT